MIFLDLDDLLHVARRVLGRVSQPSGGADDAQTPTGGVLVAADTTEVSAGSSALPDRRLDRRPHPPTIERHALGDVAVRDHGLLEAALARPRAGVFGKDAYPTLEEKAAALMHSIARNHALLDGNKRLALAATIAFLGVNGRRLTLTNDAAYELIMAVASGEIDDVSVLADRLRAGSRPG